jgi:peptide/nickel transport system permease protein
MGAYILKQLALAVPTLILLTFVAFSLTTAARGDPAEIALRQGGNDPTPEQIAAYREELGLNDPIFVRYGRWMIGLTQVDMGRSFLSQREVTEVLGERIIPTLRLGLTAFATATILGIGLGVLFGLSANSWFDLIGRWLSLLFAAIPSFWLALLLIVIVAERWRLLPVAGYGNGDPRYLILPVIALACGPAAALMRVTRGAVIEVWRQDYVRTARSRGLREVAVAMRHALPNALLPIVTLLGLRFGQILAGAIIIESIFAWPGMGTELNTAISGRDLPVIGAYVLIAGVSFIVVNLITDISYGLLDPRIRLGAGQGGRG